MVEAAARLREPGAETPTSIFTREQLEALITSDKKVFLKTPCSQCGGSAGLAKKYKDTMPMIIKSLLDGFWCKECGRLLCDKHREDHTCERLDAEKEKRRNMSPEEIRQRMEADAARQLAVEAAARDEERAAAEILEKQKSERKGRRQLLAIKSKHVDSFLQQQARDPGRFRPQVHNEILELYEKAKRISLTLYNEYEHPSSQAVGGEDWEEIKVVYARARELTGMIVVADGEALDLRNPWDPPEQDGQA